MDEDDDLDDPRWTHTARCHDCMSLHKGTWSEVVHWAEAHDPSHLILVDGDPWNP